MNLAAYSVRYPRIVAACLVALTIAGILALEHMPRQEDPVIAWRLANVVTLFPGASASRVESLITDELEKAVKEVSEVEHIYSVSRVGVSLLQIQLGDEITNVGPVWQKVRHKLLAAAGRLPPGTIGPELNDEVMGVYAVVAAIHGKDYTYRQLKDQAKKLEDDLRYLPATAATDLFGTQQEVIEVQLDQTKLAAYNLSFNNVAAAIANRNTRQPSGRVRVDSNELIIEASGEFENDNELADMVLLMTPGTTPAGAPIKGGDTGGVLRLRDVAQIKRTTIQPSEPLARINGQPAVMVAARARTNVRIDHYGEEVGQVLDRFRQSLPAGMHADVLHDLAKYTRERADDLRWSLVESILFVFLATALFMGWRASAIVSVAMPITGLVALAVFLAIGMPLNQMSAMAMIMALGMVVDCAIVVADRLYRRWREGQNIAQIAGNETGQFFMPLAVATLTIVAAFVPIYLLPGGTGEFLRAIPVGVSLCLLISFGAAITVVPWLCRFMLPTVVRRALPASDTMGDASPTQPTITKPRPPLFPIVLEEYAWYRRLIEGCVRHPVAVLLSVSLLLGAIASVGLLLRRDFFSPVQRDQFIIDVYAPQGTALAHTLEIVEPIEQMLAKIPEVTSVGSFVGRNAPLVFYNLWVQETYANHFAQLVVNVSDWRASASTARRVQEMLQAQVPEAHCIAHILEHGAPFVAPFEVRISGPSLETLDELGRRAESILASTPGVRNARDNFGNEALELVAKVNEPVARAIGIDQITVANELRYRLDGLIASHVQEGDEHVNINVRLASVQRDDIADLNAVYFKPTPDAALIPFSSVASLEPRWQSASIYRRDGQRTLTILAYPDFGLTPAQVSNKFIPQLKGLATTMPPQYHLELGGENEQRTAAESNLRNKSIYTFLLIILLVLAEFHSFRLTILVLAVIPLSVAGTMLPLWLTGWPLNFMALMGIVVLVGVTIRDAVILVDVYERRRREIAASISGSAKSESLEQLIVEGTLERTTQVVVTSVASIAGFLPLALSHSPLWPPLALVMVGGLTTETVLCLIVLPPAYLLLQRMRTSTA